MIDGDILTETRIKPHDIVFSSGLIEHFQGLDRVEIIKRHLELATTCCIIVHPSDSLYNRLFSRCPLAIQRYGFQRPYTTTEFANAVAAANGRIEVNNRFYLLYTIPILHNSRINRWVAAQKLAQRRGGLYLSVIKQAPK